MRPQEIAPSPPPLLSPGPGMLCPPPPSTPTPMGPDEIRRCQIPGHAWRPPWAPCWTPWPGYNVAPAPLLPCLAAQPLPPQPPNPRAKRAGCVSLARLGRPLERHFSPGPWWEPLLGLGLWKEGGGHCGRALMAGGGGRYRAPPPRLYFLHSWRPPWPGAPGALQHAPRPGQLPAHPAAPGCFGSPKDGRGAARPPAYLRLPPAAAGPSRPGCAASRPDD